MKDIFCTAQKAASASIMSISRQVLREKIIGVACDNYKGHINLLNDKLRVLMF
jgi:hypothetical protein